MKLVKEIKEVCCMRLKSIALVLLIFLLFVGCAGLNKTEQRVLSGGAIGAGAGTVGAAIVGGPLIVGAAVGAAAGAIGGVVVDEIDKAKQD
jgi:osmotically inducible lipoprotein OsmB